MSDVERYDLVVVYTDPIRKTEHRLLYAHARPDRPRRTSVDERGRDGWQAATGNRLTNEVVLAHALFLAGLGKYAHPWLPDPLEGIETYEICIVVDVRGVEIPMVEV